VVTSVEQLCIGVAFAHAVPSALLRIDLDRGRSLRCSHDPGLNPGVHPCQARQLLVDLRAGGPADWLGEVVGLELGGPHLVDHGGGLYRAELVEGPAWCYATTLCPPDAHDAVQAALYSAFAERGVVVDEARLSSLGLRANLDQALGVVVVSHPEDVGGAGLDAEDAARASLAACLVAEVCGTTTAQGRLR